MTTTNPRQGIEGNAMTPLQQLQLRQSEVRAEIADRLLDPEEDTERLENLTKEMRDLETRIQAALVSIEEVVTPREELEQDSEQRELETIYQRASILRYIDPLSEGRRVSGAEHELQSGLGISDEQMPIDMLLPPGPAPEEQQRADAATSVAAAARDFGRQATILDRVFTRSVAMRLGVRMAMVPPGESNYPVMLTGTTAEQRNIGTMQDAVAATFTGFSLSPTRLHARYLFENIDKYRLRGYEEQLRSDIRAVMTDAMDDMVINGDGTAPEPNGFLSELTSPADPGAVTTWGQFYKTFSDQIDGINAYMISDVIALLGSETFSYAEGLFRTGATDNGPRESAADYVRMKLGGYTVSSRIPAAASNIQTNILALTSYPGENAVCPVWRGVSLLRDPYSNSQADRTVLSVTMYWNFKIIRETGYSLWKTKVA